MTATEFLQGLRFAPLGDTIKRPRPSRTRRYAFLAQSLVHQCPEHVTGIDIKMQIGRIFATPWFGIKRNAIRHALLHGDAPGHGAGQLTGIMNGGMKRNGLGEHPNGRFHVLMIHAQHAGLNEIDNGNRTARYLGLGILGQEVQQIKRGPQSIVPIRHGRQPLGTIEKNHLLAVRAGGQDGRKAGLQHQDILLVERSRTVHGQGTPGAVPSPQLHAELPIRAHAFGGGPKIVPRVPDESQRIRFAVHHVGNLLHGGPIIAFRLERYGRHGVVKLLEGLVIFIVDVVVIVVVIDLRRRGGSRSGRRTIAHGR
mmetsp:Transcript_25571/g.60068  ORF Transcript_25571/g.60068 Transcript_25571/m.60068 type:complete len:311 (+) Transcript_25571:72-1004(+)